jgi:flavin reductase (DIM6/NTAB) family NADH-FMN oxidoreductase RutF
VTIGALVLGTDSERIGAALGRLPSGCYILTAGSGDRSTGVLVSWVQQAAFDPPSVSVCIRTGRPVASLLEVSGRFLLNVLGEEDSAMFRHFARGFAADENAFEGLDPLPTPFGPALPHCVARLGCEVIGTVAVGDHTLYVGRVVAADANAGAPYVHVRKTGSSY